MYCFFFVVFVFFFCKHKTAYEMRISDWSSDVCSSDLTTAPSYVDWSCYLPAGTSQINGVPVHRLAVDPLRDPEVFGRLHTRLEAADPPIDTELQQQWLDAQGPSVPGLEAWLDEQATRFDVVAFFTSLYATNTAGLPVATPPPPPPLAPSPHPPPPPPPLEAADPPIDTGRQQQWLDAQGPSVPGLEAWLDEQAPRFDVVAFFTYLYATTTVGLPVATRHTATALVPCAHDEPPLALHAFDRVAPRRLAALPHARR